MVMNFRFHIRQQTCPAYECSKMYIESWGSSVIVSDDGLDGWGSISSRVKGFFFLPLCPDRL
jgi:hypothetical protein